MSFFRGLFAVVVMLGVTIFSTGAFAAVPLTMTHQGRLLDATDKPVNGIFDITYRVFEVPSGGSPLWTEVHASVPVTDGLFSALLGSTVPLSADVLGSGGGGGGGALSPRYLEVSVGGTTLSPRLALSSVPSAISAGHVSGDVETAPGAFTITNSGGIPTGTISMNATPDSTSFRLNGLPPGIPVTGTLSMSASGTGARSALEGRSGSTTGTIRMMATPDSASEVMEKKGLNAVNVKLARTISSPPSGLVATDALDMDSDEDGVMDKSISSSCDATGARLKVNNIGSSGQDGVSLSALPTTSSVAIKTKGTGAEANRSITSATNPEAATVILAADLDGDGVMDNTSADSVDATGASRRLAVHNLGSSGQDGVSVDLRCSPDSAVESTELRKSGAVVCADYGRHTPFHNSRISSFFDVFTELSIEDVCDATGARQRLSSGNIGSSGNDGVEIVARPDGSSSVRCNNDSDGDGVPESDLALSVGIGVTGVAGTFTPPGKAHPRTLTESSTSATQSQNRVAYDEDCNGEADDEITQVCIPNTSSMAIKTKGTGADKNRTASISSGTSFSSASVACAVDLNGDGVMDNTIADSVDAAGARIKVNNIGSSGQDGVELSVRPTSSSVAIKTKGTGADPNRSASLVCAADLDGDGTLDRSVSTTADSTTAGIAIDEPGVQIGMKIVNKGVVKGVINIASANRMIELDSDGDGFFDHGVGVGVDPTHRIDVAGGAYCDGTNWVNASDRNSKENFTAVDGNELLDQIAQLSITRWNYKGNNQADHIGPTAQDFKATFGVGADDKSISTIDPSGIALAAIKALNNKMQELNAKTTQLEDQAREITQLKVELDAIKAMIQKQADTKN